MQPLLDVPHQQHHCTHLETVSLCGFLPLCLVITKVNLFHSIYICNYSNNNNMKSKLSSKGLLSSKTYRCDANKCKALCFVVNFINLIIDTIKI